ncbi:MAG: carboxypeptidase-like regulatory domain-containing protein [Deltaproteobacteria bacterium]
MFLALVPAAELLRSAVSAPTVQLEIERTPSHAVGVVRDPTGHPIEGAVVSGWSGCFAWRETTDASGRFAIRAHADDARVSAPDLGAIVVDFDRRTGAATIRPADSFLVAFEHYSGLPFPLAVVVALLLSTHVVLRSRRSRAAQRAAVASAVGSFVVPTLILIGMDDRTKMIPPAMRASFTLVVLAALASVLIARSLRRRSK